MVRYRTVHRIGSRSKHGIGLAAHQEYLWHLAYHQYIIETECHYCNGKKAPL